MREEVFVRLDRCLGCRACELACAVEHSAGKSIFLAPSEKPTPVRRIYIEMAEEQKVPLVCRHCEDAPCVAVCRTGAMSQDPASGIVDRNPENCVGCFMCAMVCPYGVIGRHTEVRKAVKCDRCRELETPACVSACPTGALIFATQRDFVEMMRKEAAFRIAREAKAIART